MKKVKVSIEMAKALDSLPKDEWSKNFQLTSHSRQFSGNGILMHNNKTKEYEVLNKLQPIDFARCLLIGYEIEE